MAAAQSTSDGDHGNVACLEAAVQRRRGRSLESVDVNILVVAGSGAVLLRVLAVDRGRLMGVEPIVAIAHAGVALEASVSGEWGKTGEMAPLGDNVSKRRET
ncbi:hypothetical protein MKX07_002408 [Trichoderma sp. CBMAI-0711]|nr:hypothetical protein MKX07_002408 [Trichoderma sp. CBMAI-0711]